MAHAIRLSSSGCIHDRSRHSDALLMDDQPVGMVDVVPQAVIAAGVWRYKGRRWRWRWRRSRRKAHVNRQNPADLVLLRLHIIKTTIPGPLHHHHPVALINIYDHAHRFR